MTDDLEVHPADVLAQQLDRVTGLVRTLGELYSPQEENFATGSSFIAHGLVAVSTLLSDAQGALDSLHQVCDLRMNPTPAHHENEDESIGRVAAEDELMVFPPVEPAWHQQPEKAAVDAAANTAEINVPQMQVEDDDQFARSYLELLRKLTAAEVFAAEQQALAPPGSGQNLLPLLRSLREEFQKLHRVA